MRHRPAPIVTLAALLAATCLGACTISTEVVPADLKKKPPATKKGASPTPAPTPTATATPAGGASKGPAASPLPFPTLPPAMPTVAPSPSPSVAPSPFFQAPASASPSTAASAAPASVAPSASASAAASAAPSTAPTVQASAPPPSPGTLVVSGTVYDEEGATLDGAIVSIQSLDAAVPYAATATTAAGMWVINNVPEGANVLIVASKDGFTTRRRVGSFQAQAAGTRNVVNFGAAGGHAEAGDDDPAGEAYFISDYPEIVSTTPADGAMVANASQLYYTLTFSEPLPEASRDNVEDALRLWPANAEAAGGAAATSLLGRGDDAFEGDTVSGAVPGDGRVAAGNVPYVVEEGASFLGSGATRAAVSWNAEGTEATLAFDAPLIADDADDAAYQVGLVLPDVDAAIEDADGNMLGTGPAGTLDDLAGVGAGQLLRNVFKEEDLAIADDNDTAQVGDRNWSATHVAVRGFDVAPDEDAPRLVAVDVNEFGVDTRITLSFDEPMAAFDGSRKGHTGPGTAGPTTDFVTNYTFALGANIGDLDAAVLDGTATVIATVAGAATGGERDVSAAADLLQGAPDLAGDELSFAPGCVVAHPDDFTQPGQVAIEVDPDDPRTVYLWINDKPGFLAGVDVIAVRAGGVSDPAGNAITDVDADADVATANL